MCTENNFAGFAYTATELSAYLLTIDIFIVSLKDGRIIHFKPENVEAFREWLILNKIRDCRANDGIPLNVMGITINGKSVERRSVKWLNKSWLRYFKKQ